jgi:hypothetical protein
MILARGELHRGLHDDCGIGRDDGYVWRESRSCLIALALWALVALPGCTATPPRAPSERFEIGLIGDQHYDAESTERFPKIMAEMDQAGLAFVVHVGDIGSPVYGSCNDETYLHRLDEFNRSRHPLIYTPGDNEWTDCHQAGNDDSLGRLAKVREVFFAGDRSLGQRTLALERQSADSRFAKYRENVRWTYHRILFLTLHVTGSNDNLGRTPEMDIEHAERRTANIAWLRAAFEHAKRTDARGVMILMQANPRFEEQWTQRRKGPVGIGPAPKRPSGYSAYLQALREEVLAFSRPVALVHGDSHYFRIDKPMILDDKRGDGRGSIVEHFTRAELFGYPESHWVRAIVDPSDPNVFSFRPEIVRGHTAIDARR